MRSSILNKLLSTVAVFDPADRPAGGGGGDPAGDDEHIEFQDDDTGGEGGEGGEQDADPEDDPGDDDEGGDGEDDAGGQQQPDARQSRGNRQFGALRERDRARAEENARLTRELAEMRGRMDALQNAQRAPQETPQQRAERLALLTPEERAEERVNETLQRYEANQRQLNAQLLDQADRSDFSMRCTSSPLFKKLENAVERRRSEMLQREGSAPPRWVIATYLVGERVLEQQNQRGGKGGGQRRRREEARPVRSGGDVAQPRQRRGVAAGTVEDYESRFGDVPI